MCVVYMYSGMVFLDSDLAHIKDLVKISDMLKDRIER